MFLYDMQISKGYFGIKHAFHNARVPINPHDMPPPHGPYGRSTFNYQIWNYDSNSNKWERHELDGRKHLPSLNDVIDHRNRYDNDGNNDYDDGYYDGYRAAIESRGYKYNDREQRYRPNNNDVHNAYDEYRTSKRNSNDPTDEISEFFESNDSKKKRPHRK